MRIRFIQKILDKARDKRFDKHRSYVAGCNTEIMQPAYIDANCKIGNYTYIGAYSNITKATNG